MTRRGLSVACLAMVMALWPRAGCLGLPAELAECEIRLQARPQDRRSAQCFFDVVLGLPELRIEAVRRLEGHLEHQPDQPWLHFYLGNIEWPTNHPRIEERYRVAARLFALQRDISGEVKASLNLALFLRDNGRLEQAGEALEEAAKAAKAATDPTIAAVVRIEQARHLIQGGGDLGHAYRLLRNAEAPIFAGGTYAQRRNCLSALASVTWELGRYWETMAYSERNLELARALKVPSDEAFALYFRAIAYSKLGLPTATRRERYRALVREALDAALRSGRFSIVGDAHLELGRLTEGQEADQHLERCLALARERAFGDLEQSCLGAVAGNVLDRDAGQAKRLVEEALNAALDSEDPWPLIYNWATYLPVLWTTHSRSETLDMSRRAIDALEALRDSQVFDQERVRLLSVWSDIYYRISGLLLESSQGAADPRSDIELAFQWIERLRARTLLEAEVAEVQPAPSDAGMMALAEVLRSKARVYRRLLDPRLSRPDRAAALTELDRLERQEADLRYQLASRPGAGAPRRSPPLASLAEIEASLRGNEALISFQLSFSKDLYREYAGGAWMLAITRQGTSVHRVPDRVRLEPALRLFLGLRDPQELDEAIAQLFQDLLEPALARLSPSVDRLIVVPDGMLHLLPFGVLRANERDEPLALRYELMQVPSVALWRHWRESEPPPAEHALLVLADPTVPRGPGPAGETRVGERTLAEGFHPDPLPHARREARAAMRRIRRTDRKAVFREGQEATESFVKNAQLNSFAVVHFAAHALVDDEQSDRSGVLLAAGTDDEDGLLLPREIAELDLDGRVVVLSTCSSASGNVLEGVGVMSLARAFFQAGAHVVVASLWPLPDDEAAAFFEEFYRFAATGLSVSASLAAAQRERIRQHAPAVGWAGFVALGNAQLVPFPEGLQGSPMDDGVWFVAALGLVFLGGALARRTYLRRRSWQTTRD